MTFHDLAQFVLPHLKAKKRSVRYQAIARQQLNRLEEWWGDRAADSLTPSEIETTLSEYARTDATFNRYKSTVSLAYRLGIREGKVDVNPARSVAHRTENNARLRFISEDEEKKLRAKIRETCPEREPEFDLAIYTGMRRSEQYGLHWGDVNFATGLITVQKSKHGKVRHVQINSGAKRALSTLRRLRQDDEDPVCPGGMTRTGYRDRWFFECAAKAGLGDVLWHTLRHTYISRLVMRGVDIRTAQELAGHKTIQMTARYAHLTPDHLKQAAEKAFSGAASPVVTGTKTSTRHDAVTRYGSRKY